MPEFIHWGRGASDNPPNQFERLSVALSDQERHSRATAGLGTEFFLDATRTILAQNDSPDVGFRFSINPYRGCEHGCVYCYARPGHEYLGFSGGLDFESKILVKKTAPTLLSNALSSRLWVPQVVAIAGVTDAYQPIERKLELTRSCLRVLRSFRNPVAIITKNHLVTGDIDILAEMAAMNLAKVMVSITSLRDGIIQNMEPRTSRPERRLKAIAQLTAAGIPAGVMVAPVIPGLTDEEMPEILEAAAEAGAVSAGYIMLRLPGVVEPLFRSWVESHYPDRSSKVLNRIRSMRAGRLSDSRFGHRMRGEGVFATVINDLFHKTVTRLGLTETVPLDTTRFIRSPHGQGCLFDEAS